MIWHPSIEKLFEELADESQLRNKLHYEQSRWYNNRNNHYTLPVVILSVLSGSGNFIAGQFPTVEKYLIWGIGCISITTSIISAISQFLKLAQLSESNRISSLAWGKFYSSIKFQLQLKAEDRTDPKEFMSSILSEYDRLYEISSPLLRQFVDKMTKKLKKIVTNRFVTPFYMNGYIHCESYNDNFIENTEEDEKIFGDD